MQAMSYIQGLCFIEAGGGQFYGYISNYLISANNTRYITLINGQVKYTTENKAQ